jgi:hypothetical protein
MEEENEVEEKHFNPREAINITYKQPKWLKNRRFK